MYTKIFVLVLFSILFALAALAAPQPENQLEERSDINLTSVIVKATSHIVKAASELEGIHKTVESIGGEVFTIITSEDGKGYTLAASGFGVATSLFGSIYTVATSSSSSSAAFVPHAGVQTSLLVALGSVLVGALLGMTMVL